MIALKFGLLRIQLNGNAESDQQFDPALNFEQKNESKIGGKDHKVYYTNRQ